MSLPVILPGNTLSIYGYRSLNGITSAIKDSMQFGIVDQMYFGAQVNMVGQSVLFRLDKSIRLDYNNAQYFLVQEGDITLFENVPEAES